MVAGKVLPPQIDLTNEDLIRAHVQAVWLAETGLGLGTSLRDLLDIEGETPSLDLLDRVKDDLRAAAPKERASMHASQILASIQGELAEAGWYSDGWLDEVFAHLSVSFEQACDRWRGLYLAALRQAQRQSKIIQNAASTPADRNQAQRLRRDAESQLDLLRQARNVTQSDFYSYRYFASEGFLPGYNFPRLPLSAYIPGRRFRGGRDEFLSRPRFLAISEFGPRAVVYHEGSHYVINRVILPVRDDEELQMGAAKLCPKCGYLHPGVDGQGPDLCEHCNATLGAPLRKLFRLQNVVTKRRDRINCDEEDRLRLGFDLRTVVRFATRGGEVSCRVASVAADGDTLATLSYGNAATLWRINLGRRRRKDQQQYGFLLDVERGYWARNEEDKADEDPDPTSPRTERVIPYVEDRKNCLIFEPAKKLNKQTMATLQSALKRAIQTTYELEDNELAAEPLPDLDNRRSILFYEAGEGGAGVLRRMLDDQNAISRVARKALELCHFDPETSTDLRRADSAKEDCEAACYDCLMSYSNQMDHDLLDRQLTRELFLQMASAEVKSSPVAKPRAAHLAQLARLAGSGLERQWLEYLEAGNYRLPTDGQTLMEQCGTRPDFLYADRQVAVYIDGPPHDYPDRKERDRQQTDCLEDAGWSVVRFDHNDDWQSIIDANPSIFGDGS